MANWDSGFGIQDLVKKQKENLCVLCDLCGSIIFLGVGMGFCILTSGFWILFYNFSFSYLIFTF